MPPSAQPLSDRPPRAPRRPAAVARREICEAALQFLAERPFRDLTVEGLMARTGQSRPGFYRHFAGLHELIESLLQGLAEQIGAVANPWIAGEGEVEAALQLALRGVVQVGVEQGPVLRAVFEAAPYDARLEHAWASFMEHWDTGVGAQIEVQQAEGRIPSFDAAFTARALNALNASVLIQSFGRPPGEDPERVLKTLRHIWFSSLYGSRSRQPSSDGAGDVASLQDP